ncbi:hypothetical protein [Amycolatopsis sp.]|uniref:hypothetical protein n=1 Tax=Amycolatopsis sp. TaxID=37632 RepID=UPI002E064AFF|nr:hypothetical protein [Amycolatopsis sp.]
MNCSNSAWARDRGDPIHTAVSAVHRYQIQARCQRDPSASQFALAEVTRHKGGHGTLAVFALVRPNLGRHEQELILEIGETLQLLDDYLDVDEDRRNHTRTLATEGQLNLEEVCRRLPSRTRPIAMGHRLPSRRKPLRPGTRRQQPDAGSAAAGFRSRRAGRRSSG